MRTGGSWDPGTWGALLLLVVPVKARPLRPGFLGFSLGFFRFVDPANPFESLILILYYIWVPKHPDIDDDIGWLMMILDDFGLWSLDIFYKRNLGTSAISEPRSLALQYLSLYAVLFYIYNVYLSCLLVFISGHFWPFLANCGDF